MLVLGIESSCDECSLALVEDGRVCIAMQTYSQTAEHARYAGVVPELASRLHLQYISRMFRALLEQAGVKREEIYGIAVTAHPGLSGSLMVGMSFAKALSVSLGVPFVAVDHMQAHFYAANISLPNEQSAASSNSRKKNAPLYPTIGMVASGGHTIIALVRGYNDIDIKGTTIDDACGEVFDKVAREIGFGYPGGAALDAAAQNGDDRAFNFPVYSEGYNFSYSGLKTAVIHHRKKYQNDGFEDTRENVAASFSKAAVGMIESRVRRLAAESGVGRVCFGGGVACNSYLRAAFAGGAIEAIFPHPDLCSDNGAMIAGLGYEYLSRGFYSPLDAPVNARSAQYRRRPSSKSS